MIVPTNWQRPADAMPEPHQEVLIWDGGFARLGHWTGHSWVHYGGETKRDPEWWAPFEEPPK